MNTQKSSRAPPRWLQPNRDTLFSVHLEHPDMVQNEVRVCSIHDQ